MCQFCGLNPDIGDGGDLPEARAGLRAHRIEAGGGAPVAVDNGAGLVDINAEADRIGSHEPCRDERSGERRGGFRRVEPDAGAIIGVVDIAGFGGGCAAAAEGERDPAVIGGGTCKLAGEDLELSRGAGGRDFLPDARRHAVAVNIPIGPQMDVEALLLAGREGHPEALDEGAQAVNHAAPVCA